MKINIINLQGDITKTIHVPDCLQYDMNPILLKEVIEYFQNKNRGNYACVKSKNELSYSKRKRIKQKGTGHARTSNMKQSQHRGGVSLFGPGGQVYEYKIPKKKIKISLAMVLSDKFKHQELFICDTLDTNNHKTKEFTNNMKKLSLDNCLFVDEEIPHNFNLSMRNVPNMDLIKTSALNALNASKRKNVILTERAFMEVQRRING